MFAIIASSILLAAAQEGELLYEAPDCIEYLGYSRKVGGQYFLRFRNRCPVKKVIAVCLGDYAGKNKFYQSSRSVPVNGTYEIILHEGVLPRSLDWTSEPGEVPFPCTS